MIKRIIVISFALFAIAVPAKAQSFGGWCGYMLIEDLPLLENQLSVLAAITPTKSQFSKPNELFQYRYSLDRTKVIIEGCWQVEPSRELLVSLLSLSVTGSREAIDSKGGVSGELPINATQRDINRAYIDSKLRYSIFAPGERVEISAAACRAYLAANITEWEANER